MDYELIKKNVEQIAERVLDRSIHLIDADRLLHEQGLDEFDLLQIIMDIEDHFNIIIDDEILPQLQSIRQICQYLLDIV